MNILCPNCQFSREVPDDKVPARSVMATCPKCGTKFRFRELDSEAQDFTLEEEPAAQTAQAATIEPTEPHVAPDVTPDVTPDAAPDAPEAPQADAPTQDIDEPATSASETPADGPIPTTDATPVAPVADVTPNAASTPQTPTPEEQPAQAESPTAEKPRRDIWVSLEDMGDKNDNRDETPWRGHAPREDEHPTVDVPFERLDEHGFFGGLKETVKRACLSPKLFFSTMPVKMGLARPMVFYLLVSEVSALFQTIWQVLGLDIMMYIGGGQTDSTEHAVAGASAFAVLLVLPIFMTLAIIATTGIIHLLLMAFGASKSGFEATFRVNCYASSPSLLAVFPVLGPLAGSLWYMVLMCIGLKEAHRTSYARVSLALSLPLFLLLALVAATVFFSPETAQQMF
ncbi:putative Zn finger-like uncharacterized protein [Desulfobaculum xiamenense]|uniref:Putative Zn finger-like uncharacterized protein n=1 Tax=Desulfobaculum xiamenense TaxID=995050 RepID=A0A846QKM0_9BACT|nr:YIP1 family protein [Desulfobaculum xiamenense]NJB67600.1 putative Zn finger-like uncharacterized protein [Desulfobaculum xiamenense]